MKFRIAIVFFVFSLAFASDCFSVSLCKYTLKNEPIPFHELDPLFSDGSSLYQDFPKALVWLHSRVWSAIKGASKEASPVPAPSLNSRIQVAQWVQTMKDAAMNTGNVSGPILNPPPGAGKSEVVEWIRQALSEQRQSSISNLEFRLRAVRLRELYPNAGSDSMDLYEDPIFYLPREIQLEVLIRVLSSDVDPEVAQELKRQMKSIQKTVFSLGGIPAAGPEPAKVGMDHSHLISSAFGGLGASGGPKSRFDWNPYNSIGRAILERLTLRYFGDGQTLDRRALIEAMDRHFEIVVINR